MKLLGYEKTFNLAHLANYLAIKTRVTMVEISIGTVPQ